METSNAKHRRKHKTGSSKKKKKKVKDKKKDHNKDSDHPSYVLNEEKETVRDLDSVEQNMVLTPEDIGGDSSLLQLAADLNKEMIKIGGGTRSVQG